MGRDKKSAQPPKKLTKNLKRPRLLVCAVFRLPQGALSERQFNRIKIQKKMLGACLARNQKMVVPQLILCGLEIAL
jgi:hypothetical protein